MMTMVTVPTLLVPLPNPPTTAMSLEYASQPDAFESVSNYGGAPLPILPKRSSLPLTKQM